MLVGGLGKGGKGYFALDITDPGSFTTQENAAANVMWEFTSADDNALGYSYSPPLIAMSNDGDIGSKTAVAIFGNGYENTSADGHAYLFVVKLAGNGDGTWNEDADYIKIDTGIAADANGVANGISGIRGIDIDADGTVDYVYAGDLRGNLHRFDLTGDMSSWGHDGILFTAKYEGTDPVQPITNAPIVVEHPSEGGYIVIVGTGTWMYETDRSDTSIQSIYGIWDDFANNMTPVTHAQLVEQNFINHQNREEGYIVRTSTDNLIDWNNNGNDLVRGWVINLDIPPASGGANPEFPGERAVRRFQYRGGILFVNTVIPKTGNADPCVAGAGGWELGFCPETGGAPNPQRDPPLDCDKIIFDLNRDNEFSNLDNVGDVAANISANIVTGKQFEDSTPADSSFIGDIQVTQTSDKSIESTKTNTSDTVLQGRHSWREVQMK
jgi:type IV pilus assembly protein PilY1